MVIRKINQTGGKFHFYVENKKKLHKRTKAIYQVLSLAAPPGKWLLTCPRRGLITILCLAYRLYKKVEFPARQDIKNIHLLGHVYRCV